ncbi:dehydrogenase [Arthrobacter crystallopoietes BAB-32]|uniref:Dehydrogenase n=1 Tax=Arthrobacter crystallopoietes BAB-32 TaxID=1246476 RepID=N1V070_9MICC|nr:Gfo/Idh/MocA family oxidoreductase [Arthrobacter crystallopoietes]EMY33424.1 dehydrogenase [Arthrobacter crystallopoietes BAB-32]
MAYLERPPAQPEPVRLALAGCGWIGAFHAESVANRIAGTRLEAIADPALDAATALADRLGTAKVTAEAADLWRDPDIDGVIIAAPARFHASLITEAAAAGKHIFCEKPAARSLEELDGALAAVEAAGVELQIGFNRRFAADFAAAKRVVEAGAIGVPRLLRSLTRDPGTAEGIPHAGRIPPGTIFLETLIHDFDTLNWFNQGAVPQQVHVMADALVEPGLKDQGFLDTAVATIRYSNGAIAVAEANFSALYGYDVRGEVFGSAGMTTAGSLQETAATVYTEQGFGGGTPRLNVELFHDAYTAELAHFADVIRHRRDGTPAPEPAAPGGADARTALAVALACIRSVETGAPVNVADILPSGVLPEAAR